MVTERDEMSQRVQAEAKENSAVFAAPSRLYTFYSSAPVLEPEQVASSIRLSEDLGPPSYTILPQLYQ